MAEVKGLKDWQKPANSKQHTVDRGIKKQTFTIGDMLVELGRAKIDQLYMNIVRGGRR